MQKERLNKYLASCGVCSRRDADKLIEEGRIQVNGQKAVMGLQVSDEDEIVVNGKHLPGKNDKVVYAYYKPLGVTCTERDRHADKVLTQQVKLPVRVTYAGRLDKDSEGLILLTNDGDLIHTMMNGSGNHEKEYIVKVNKEITGEFLQNMADGVFLKELNRRTKPCKVEKIGKFTFQITLTQGVNRQIRRMSHALGFEVTAIKRIRVSTVELAGLLPGKYRQITGIELQMLYNSCMKNTSKYKEL